MLTQDAASAVSTLEHVPRAPVLPIDKCTALTSHAATGREFTPFSLVPRPSTAAHKAFLLISTRFRLGNHGRICFLRSRVALLSPGCLNSSAMRTNNSICGILERPTVYPGGPFPSRTIVFGFVHSTPPLISPSCPSIGQSSSSLPLPCLVACWPCALHHRCAHLDRLIPQSHISIEICSSP